VKRAWVRIRTTRSLNKGLDSTTRMAITAELVVVLSLILFMVACCIILTVGGARQQRRFRALLPTLPCPRCGVTYGGSILSSVEAYSVLHRGCMYGVACPHCSRKSYYRPDGRLEEGLTFSDATDLA
jgi:hypothetical protein